MPFTSGEARHMTDAIGPKVVGDRCFVFYRPMVRAWRASPRWTTAHELYRKMKDEVKAMEETPCSDMGAMRDDVAAYELAWQVFFLKHVWPYEQMQCNLNGEVDY